MVFNNFRYVCKISKNTVQMQIIAHLCMIFAFGSIRAFVYLIFKTFLSQEICISTHAKFVHFLKSFKVFSLQNLKSFWVLEGVFRFAQFLIFRIISISNIFSKMFIIKMQVFWHVPWTLPRVMYLELFYSIQRLPCKEFCSQV